MNDTIGKWGYVNSSTHIAMEQRAEFDKKNLSGATMHCIGSDEAGRLVLRFAEDMYSVDPLGFCLRPDSPYSWGDRVHVTSKDIDGTIAEICWHYNEQRYFYHVVTTEGKRLKKRYYPDEIEKIES